MPELPEVETVKSGLARLLPGKTIVKVKYDWQKSFPNARGDVNEFLIGAKIERVRRRAKVIIIDLDSNYSLLIHLKMTGQLVFVDLNAMGKDIDDVQERGENRSKLYERYSAGGSESLTQHSAMRDNRGAGSASTQDEPLLVPGGRFGAGHPSDSLIGDLPDRTTRVIFDFHDGSKLFFNDLRKFGWARLLPTPEIPYIDFFKKLGPEPLADDFTPKEFRERLMKRKNSSVKAALIDQTVIAGVGNIYADESLWMSKIHPQTTLNMLSINKLNTLFKELRSILRFAIESGGSSDRNYVNAEGKKGSYLGFANAYKREGQPCNRCGTEMKKIKVAGRGTRYCPRCQKL